MPSAHHHKIAMMACRLALHMTTSNRPLKKADVRAALAVKDSQGRRRLMSSVAGVCHQPPSGSIALTQLACSTL